MSSCHYIFIVAVFTIGQVFAVCNVTALDACLANFNPWSVSFQSSFVNTSNITAGCRSFNETSKCISATATCADFEVPTLTKWVGQKNALTYICNIGQQDYLRNQKCLSRSEIQTGFVKCDHTNPDNRADIACRALNNKISCISNVTRNLCGNDTAQFMDKISPGMYAPEVSVNAPGCTGYCNPMILDVCLQSFKTYADGFLFATVDASNITAACKAYADATTCVMNKANCSDTDPITMKNWIGMKNIAAYTCGDGRAVYLANQKCLGSNVLMTLLHGCVKPSIANNPAEAACKAVNDQIACEINASNTTCNQNATHFMKTNVIGYLGPSTHVLYPNCIVNGQCDKTSMDVCLARFDRYAQGFVYDTVDPLNITSACSAYDEAVNCITTKAMCADHVLVTMSKWTGLKSAVGFICGEGRADYLSVQRCLNEAKFGRFAPLLCLKPVAPELSSDAVCKELNIQTMCFGTLAKSMCGDVAGQFISKLAPSLLGPQWITQYPACTTVMPGSVRSAVPVVTAGSSSPFLSVYLSLAAAIITSKKLHI